MDIQRNPLCYQGGLWQDHTLILSKRRQTQTPANPQIRNIFLSWMTPSPNAWLSLVISPSDTLSYWGLLNVSRLNLYPCLLFSGFLLLFFPLRLTIATSCFIWSSHTDFPLILKCACSFLPWKSLRYEMTLKQNCCCCLVAKSCPSLSVTPMDYSLPGSSVHGISQTRILAWVAISFSRGSSSLRGWTLVSCIGRQVLYHWATMEAP